MDTLLHLTIVAISTVCVLSVRETDETHTLRQEASVVLPCSLDISVDDYLAGRASFAWTKSQPSDWSPGAPEADTITLNQGPTLNSDLPEDLKEKISTRVDQTNGVSQPLTLSDVRPQESGVYVCTTTLNGVPDSVTYTVRVLTDVNEVLVYSMADANQVPQDVNTSSWQHQDQVEFGTKTPGYLACVSRGGYPAPTIQATVGSRTITGDLDYANEVMYHLVGDTPFLMVYESYRIIATNNYPVRMEDNGQRITCTATIDDGDNNEAFTPTSASASLVVNSAVDFKNCSLMERAAVGDENVELRCEFVAVPAPSTVQWQALTTGETVRRRDGTVGDYTASMLTLEGENNFVAILRLSVVNEDDFQRYRLTIINSEGNSEITIQLLEGESQATQKASALWSSLLTLLVAMVASILLS